MFSFRTSDIFRQEDLYLHKGRIMVICNQSSWNPHSRQYLFEGFFSRGNLSCVMVPPGDGLSEHPLSASVPFNTISLAKDGSFLFSEDDFASADAVVVELQDAGCRYFGATNLIAALIYFLHERNAELPVYIVDRPNPAGRQVEGTALRAGYRSHIGIEGIPHRYGMTLGELAYYLYGRMNAKFPLHIISANVSPVGKLVMGWTIPMSSDFGGFFTDSFYSGQYLWRGTNVTPGEGTTRPYELFGAPFMEGITLEDNTGTFTTGYKENNSGVNPTTIFSTDLTGVMAVSPDDNNEVQLTNSLPDGDIYYIERSWDDASQTVKAEIKILASGSYTTLTGGDDITIQPGFYVVKSNIEHDDIDLVGDGVHHLILCDGAQVEADIVHVAPGHTLHIYGQAANSGKLYIPMGNDDEFEKESGIGGRNAEACGNVIIHGGDIHAEGKDLGGAGIGGGQNGNGGNVTIYGGNVFAQGGGGDDICGAGIGGGNAANGGTVTIYGGTIKADGYKGGAGIGSGNNDSHHGGTGPLSGERSPITGGTVIIYGGYVEAYGTDGGAGIGGGNNGGGADVTINGGIVKANGGSSGAGIGTGIQGGSDAVHYTGKLTVNGGEVYAYGGDDAAGIGGGDDVSGSDVTINGGYVYAKGDGNGAGIGSGCEGIWSGGKQGGSLTVTGGRVEAYGGEDAAGIGGGEDADGGTVTISGGYVYAKGSYGGAGIGGGEGGDGANVTITGGTVHASAGSGDTGNRAIGPGYGDDVYGSLTIGDEMMVYSERMAAAVERHDMCWYRTDVHVELCTHPGYTADTCPYHKH